LIDVLPAALGHELASDSLIESFVPLVHVCGDGLLRDLKKRGLRLEYVTKREINLRLVLLS
jgi:hypothetical protein